MRAAAPQVHTGDPFEEANVIRKAHRIKASNPAGLAAGLAAAPGAWAACKCAAAVLRLVRTSRCKPREAFLTLESFIFDPFNLLPQVSGSAPPPPLRSFAELEGRAGCGRRLLR